MKNDRSIAFRMSIAANHDTRTELLYFKSKTSDRGSFIKSVDESPKSDLIVIQFEKQDDCVSLQARKRLLYQACTSGDRWRDGSKGVTIKLTVTTSWVSSDPLLSSFLSHPFLQFKTPSL